MDPDGLIEVLPAERRDDVRRLDALIRDVLPDAARGTSGQMLGYGPFRYRYATGREGDAFLVALADRKAGISLYVTSVRDGAYLPEHYAARLDKVDVGRSCIRFRGVDDVDLGVLRELLAEAGRTGGAAAV